MHDFIKAVPALTLERLCTKQTIKKNHIIYERQIRHRNLNDNYIDRMNRYQERTPVPKLVHASLDVFFEIETALEQKYHNAIHF